MIVIDVTPWPVLRRRRRARRRAMRAIVRRSPSHAGALERIAWRAFTHEPSNRELLRDSAEGRELLEAVELLRSRWDELDDDERASLLRTEALLERREWLPARPSLPTRPPLLDRPRGDDAATGGGRDRRLARLRALVESEGE